MRCNLRVTPVSSVRMIQKPANLNRTKGLHRISHLLRTICIAVTLMIASANSTPASAGQNPIAAAKEAIKKAQEEFKRKAQEEAQRTAGQAPARPASTTSLV